MKNFGEFYNNQIETANTIILSRTDGMTEEKLDQCVKMIREHNKDAVIVTTPWPELTGEQLMEAMEQRSTIAIELAKLEWLVYHAPVDYVNLLLHGDVREYLRNVTEYHPFEN